MGRKPKQPVGVAPIPSDEGQYRPALWEKVTAAVLAALIVLTVLVLSAQKDEIPARNFALLRILLSAAMGVIGGVIPGFLHVKLTGYGALIRAGGGLALAVLTYFFTPQVVPTDPPKNADALKLSPASHSSPTPAGPLPLARIENFGGTVLIHKGGDKYERGGVLELFNKEGMLGASAYPAISFDLSKPRPGVVKLDRMRVIWAPAGLDGVLVFGMRTDNFKPPLTFLTKLDRKKAGCCTETIANIKTDEGITDGSIDFSDEMPLRKCRVEFEGTPGIYQIASVELDLADVRTGEKATLKGSHEVFISIPSQRDEPSGVVMPLPMPKKM